MATTMVYDYSGLTATVDPEKVAEIVESYVEAQGNEDKADDPDDVTYYEGQKNAYLHVLNLLHDTTSEKMDAEGRRKDPR